MIKKPLQRPAWVEIDTWAFRQNWRHIFKDKPDALSILFVVKDNAYGHGSLPLARIALEEGCSCLATVTVTEAISLREYGITDTPILVLGERTESELHACVQYNLTCCINSVEAAERYTKICQSNRKTAKVHVEIDTGLSRYGIRWTQALSVIEYVDAQSWLQLEGMMSHFAMSDELDKTFATLQLARFQQVIDRIQHKNIDIPLLHMCNTGGYLDLPQAHFSMVRIGILPLGVYPSQVCRRIQGLKPVMSVKTRIIAVQQIEAGDSVGYGMHFKATAPMRIGVIPLGYGDGYPRVRNRGHVLVCGKTVPVVGGNAMDATMVDLTGTPEAAIGDEVVLLGKQGQEEIDVHALAALQGTVSYHILTGWRSRLPRIYRNKERT